MARRAGGHAVRAAAMPGAAATVWLLAAVFIARAEVPPTAGRIDPIGNPLWAVPLETLPATRDRPIFSPSRRPPPPAAAALPVPVEKPAPASAAGPDPPPLTLVGTIIGGSVSIGVFLAQSTNEVVRLREGQHYQGWLLRSVRGRDVSLEQGALVAIVALPRPDAAQAPATIVSRSGGSVTEGGGQLVQSQHDKRL